MSSSATGVHAPPGLDFDPGRGTGAMWLFVVTEAALFVMLFFAYFYLGHIHVSWPLHDAPPVRRATIMLVILLASSLVLWGAERAEKRERYATARLCVTGTLVLGAVFIVMQVMEYRERLKHLEPDTDAYGSIWYTMTSVHGVHVLLGMTMLAYVLLLPRWDADRPPQRSLHNAALYWHFVDVVWIFVVAVLYYLPQVYRG